VGGSGVGLMRQLKDCLSRSLAESVGDFIRFAGGLWESHRDSVVGAVNDLLRLLRFELRVKRKFAGSLE